MLAKGNLTNYNFDKSILFKGEKKMKKVIVFVLFGSMLIAGSSFCRKPPHDIVYPVTLDKLGDFITDLGYHYDKVSTKGREGEISERISLRISGDNGVFDIGVQLFESVDIVYMYISNYMSLPLDKGSSVPMLTYLMSQNWDMTFGKFEWDIDDGELRYSHTLPIDDGISKETFQAYFTTMLNVADERLPELESTLEDFED
ncbi:hypothetical protein DRQ36_09135 [bacterium]|nr:MAG: hypothetical protein DRQ36_09135 [bacterium]